MWQEHIYHLTYIIKMLNVNLGCESLLNIIYNVI